MVLHNCHCVHPGASLGMVDRSSFRNTKTRCLEGRTDPMNNRGLR